MQYIGRLNVLQASPKEAISLLKMCRSLSGFLAASYLIEVLALSISVVSSESVNAGLCPAVTVRIFDEVGWFNFCRGDIGSRLPFQWLLSCFELYTVQV